VEYYQCYDRAAAGGGQVLFGYERIYRGRQIRRPSRRRDHDSRHGLHGKETEHYLVDLGG
jgi:hypothetical protein